jgi:hypothetical protein
MGRTSRNDSLTFENDILSPANELRAACADDFSHAASR